MKCDGQRKKRSKLAPNSVALGVAVLGACIHDRMFGQSKQPTVLLTNGIGLANQ